MAWYSGLTDTFKKVVNNPIGNTNFSLGNVLKSTPVGGAAYGINSLINSISKGSTPTSSGPKVDPAQQAYTDRQMGVYDKAFANDPTYNGINPVGLSQNKGGEQYGPSKPTPTSGGGGGGIRPTAGYVQDYAAFQKQLDSKFEQTLQELLNGGGIGTAFKDNTFDEAGAAAEAAALFNPEFDRQQQELTDLVGLDKRSSNEEFGRTAAELAQIRGINDINASTRATSIADTLGAAGTVRSGVGMRQAGLNTIKGVQDVEENDRLGNNNTQVRNLALARADNRMTTGSNEITRNRQTTLAEELQKRRSKFQESEDKRRTDYSNDYYQAYNNALTKVYGG